MAQPRICTNGMGCVWNHITPENPPPVGVTFIAGWLEGGEIETIEHVGFDGHDYWNLNSANKTKTPDVWVHEPVLSIDAQEGYSAGAQDALSMPISELDNEETRIERMWNQRKRKRKDGR